MTKIVGQDKDDVEIGVFAAARALSGESNRLTKSARIVFIGSVGPDYFVSSTALC